MSTIIQDKDKISLSTNAIRDIINLEITEQRKTYNVNYTLQVTQIKKSSETASHNMQSLYTATLCDKYNYYNRFLLCKYKDSQIPKEGEYIILTQVCPMKLISQPDTVILIKEYNCLGQIFPINQTISVRDQTINQQVDENKNNFYYTPLNHLTTFTKDFVILVKVIHKSDIKIFNTRSSGTLFDFVVSDEEGSRIQIVCFDKIVTKFFNIIQPNKVYEIQNGYIKVNDRKYNSLRSEYKIILNDNTIIKEKNDIISTKFKTEEETLFVQIKDLSNKEVNSYVNVLCVVMKEGEIIEKTTRSGVQEMRNCVIIDLSGGKVELTLWRQYAKMNIKKDDILLLKKVKVGDFGGRNLSTVNETTILINPENTQFTSQIKDLNDYYTIYKKNNLLICQSSETNKPNPNNQIQNNKITQNINPQQTHYDQIDFIQDIIDLMDNDNQDNSYNNRFQFYKIKATVIHMNHNDKNYYAGCPDKECARKVIQEMNKFICNKCHKAYDKPFYYYSLNLKVKDCSCEHYIDIFGKTAENFMKMNASEYRNLLLDQDMFKLKEITKRILYKEFYFVVKPKMQSFNGVLKKKFTANKIEYVDCVNDSYRILHNLKNKIIPQQ